MNKAIGFDLDGTLWDATAPVVSAWNRVFAREGLSRRLTAADVHAVMGKTMDEIGAALLGDLSPARRGEIMDACGDEEVAFLRVHGATLYPGVPETLRSLAGWYDLYLVSNCQRGYAQSFLDAHGLRALFIECVEAGDTGLSKGENLRALVQRRGIERGLYVGDTAGDEAAARFASLPFVHAAYGFGAAKAPDAVLRSIAELPALAERLLR